MSLAYLENRNFNSPELYQLESLLVGHESIFRKLLLSGAIVSIEISIPLDEVSIRRKPIKYRLNGTLSKNVIPTYSIPEIIIRRRIAGIRSLLYFFFIIQASEKPFPPFCFVELSFSYLRNPLQIRVIYSFVSSWILKKSSRERISKVFSPTKLH